MTPRCICISVYDFSGSIPRVWADYIIKDWNAKCKAHKPGEVGKGEK